MAIKPKDLEGITRKLDPKYLKSVQTWEKRIDEYIKKNYAGPMLGCTYTYKTPIREEVLEELVRRYKKAGWRVEVDYDQRDDEYFIEFGLRKKRIDAD